METAQRTQPDILAALVLYGRPAAESPAFTALNEFQQQNGGQAHIDLLLFDNSNPGYAPPAQLNGTYVPCPSNPGLAGPYNHALAQAEARGIRWLMLLDQDTHVTCEYLQEVLDSTAAAPAGGGVALVPRLLSGTALLSPHARAYRPTQPPLDPDICGISSRRLHYFNSGAVLSVAALRAIGGFPPAFWLDYLDHAVFFQLQQRGGCVQILHSALQHELASNSYAGPVTPARLQRERNIREAAMRYYRLYEPGHRLLQHRIALLRQAAHFWRAGRRALAHELASTALRGKGDHA